MKRALLCVVMAFAMLASACYNHGVEEEGVFPGVTVLTLETADSRTSLGEKEGDTYPVYWSEGDRIALNGKRSEVADINTDNPKVANSRFGYSAGGSQSGRWQRRQQFLRPCQRLSEQQRGLL